MSTQAISPYEGNTGALQEYSVKDVVAQVVKIQTIMKDVMRDGEHFGVIPGCQKPSLLKPGAEKLGFTFRLAPKFQGETDPKNLGSGHREYIIKCELYHIQSGVFYGSGVGSCSTMEAKYRYRTGPKEFTGKPVPKTYWDVRKSNPKKAQEFIGGIGFSVGKNDHGQWEICRQGEKVEHDNPADYYNTVLKMAKKRAHVDAILTATAASDIFTQDLEEMEENGILNAQPTKQDNKKQTSKSNGEDPGYDGPSPDQEEYSDTPPPPDEPPAEVRKISRKQQGMFFKVYREVGWTDDEAKAELKKMGYAHTADIPMGDFDDILEHYRNNGPR